MFKKAENINEVISALNNIIEESINTSSPLGYFAALYKNVTIKVKDGIERNYFDDNSRMEKLDVIFANRYLEAYYNYKQNKTITKSWQSAFELSQKYRPIVLQHLLIGMNAHINLDLGIASFEVMNGKNLSLLKSDFNKINTILSSLVHTVENSLSEIWPTLKWILKLSGKVDNFLIDFSMKLARDGAWKFALSLENASHLIDLIAQRDIKIFTLSEIIKNPGFIANLLFFIIRIGEKGTIPMKIRDLENI